MQPSMLDSQVTFSLTFRTEPMEWQAPKFTTSKSGKPIVYSPKIYKEYKEALAKAMKIAWRRPAEGGEFWVEYTFHCGSEGRKNDRDGDNMAKAVGDAGNKVIWKDDRQITLWRRIEVFRNSMNPCTVIEGGLR